MTIKPSDSPNGHGQNDHFGYDHNSFFIIKWSWSNDQNLQIFQQFQQISTAKNLEMYRWS
jgi:hypothetical protein